MKVYFKNIFRQIKSNATRYVLIILIVMLGVAFYAGMRATSVYMENTIYDYYDQTNYYDIEVKSLTGFTESDLESFAKQQAVSQAVGIKSGEALLNKNNKTYSFKTYNISGANDINKLDISQGDLDISQNEILVDQRWAEDNCAVGDVLSLNGKDYTVKGIVKSPYYVSLDRDSNSTGQLFDGYIFMSDENFSLPVYSQIMLRLDLPQRDYYSAGYEKLINEQINSLKTNYKTMFFSGSFSNVGFDSYKQDCERIAAISNVFPILFFLIAALVSLTSMTRLVETDRTQIGILKALGFSSFAIMFQYIFFAITATFTGAIIGYFLGIYLLPRLIVHTYGIMYLIPAIKTPIIWLLAFSSIGWIVLSTVVPTILSIFKTLLLQPAALLRPKAPLPGKRIFLERIGFIWKRLKFIHKVTARNLFRYKKRVVLMLLGILGATALLVVAYGLRESVSLIITKHFDEITRYDYIVQINDDYGTTESLEASEIVSDTTFVNTEGVKIVGENIQQIFAVTPKDPLNFNDFINLRNRKTKEKIVIKQGETVITEQLAMNLGVTEGDEIEVDFGDTVRKIRVGAIAENYVYHYLFLYPEQTENFKTIYVKFNDLASTDTVNELSEKLTVENKAIYVSWLSKEGRQRFQDTVNSLSIVILVLNFCAMALSFIVLFSLTNINIEERKRELATLKVLGFYDYETASYLYRESIILTVLGAFLGFFAGHFLLEYLINTMETNAFMFVRDFSWSIYLYSFLLTIAFSVVVNVITFFRIKKIDMVSALKSPE